MMTNILLYWVIRAGEVRFLFAGDKSLQGKPVECKGTNLQVLLAERCAWRTDRMGGMDAGHCALVPRAREQALS
jgi:hypothetical protein